MTLEPGRSGLMPRRLVHVGDLSPQSGAADILISLAIWAERHPRQLAEIWWVGEGDLAGVFAAQPVPDNVSQRFLGQLDPPGMAGVFAQCGLLVVPSVRDDGHAPVADALAAGLPVLGCRRNRRVSRLVCQGINGWLFDPAQPMDMLAALSRALAVSAGQHGEMRANARAAGAGASRGATGRTRRGIGSLLPGWALRSAPAAITLRDA